MTDEEPSKSLMIFGRDVGQIPCFRSSFLYGICGGMTVGALTFLRTSRPQFSTHVGFGSFVLGTFGYWFVCRYQWSKTKFEYQQLKAAMKQQARYEGTDLEKKLQDA